MTETICEHYAMCFATTNLGKYQQEMLQLKLKSNSLALEDEITNTQRCDEDREMLAPNQSKQAPTQVVFNYLHKI